MTMDIKDKVLRLEEIEKLRLEIFKYMAINVTDKNVSEKFRKLNDLNVEYSKLMESIENQVQNVYKIYVVESPSDKDLIEKRTEGKGLIHYFGLANISSEYYLVGNGVELSTAFKEIAKDVKEIKSSLSVTDIFNPVIHFSGHGNDELFGLTDNSYLSWTDLGKELYDLNIAAGIDLTERISDFIICLSVCHGAKLKDVIKNGNGTPFFAMIGPTVSIDWTEAITAFQTFYHSFIIKEKIFSESLKIMKTSSGYDKLECLTDSRIKLTEK